MKRILMVLSVVCVARLCPAAEMTQRWVYVPNNLYVDANLPKLEGLCQRAKAAGYTGIFFTDVKTLTWWKLDSPERWLKNARQLRQITSDLKLDLYVGVFPFGYAESFLFHDPNLASGMPVKNAPLAARGGKLVPIETAALKNGSFEEHQGDKVSGFGYQDSPGTGSFVDTAVVKEGAASVRFEDIGAANEAGNGRVSQQIAVKPWQQYRLRVWMKCEALNASMIQVLVLGGKRTLQYQYVMAPQDGRLQHTAGARDLTCDWTEQSVTFNSLDNSQVTVYAGIWGGKTGKIWWDDFRIDAAPLMNVLRRDSLPLTILGTDGTVYAEGVDFEPVRDPGLGAKPWKGSYDTRHEAPMIALTTGSRIKEGQEVLLSCYHTGLVYGGQVNCSMDDPAIFSLCAEQVRHCEESLAPDGYFMGHDEIRFGGWEPAQERFGSTGALFAENIRRCQEILKQECPGKPVHVWSDMYDPNHNARADYYLAKGDIAGSWAGLDSPVRVMKWGGGKLARPGLEFFAGRGHTQMVAGFYDGGVRENHTMWIEAMQGLPNIEGVMYTTWRNDYTKLEEFAKVWWGE